MARCCPQLKPKSGTIEFQEIYRISVFPLERKIDMEAEILEACCRRNWVLFTPFRSEAVAATMYQSCVCVPESLVSTND